MRRGATGCQMSGHADCGVTTPIRNSLGASIKVVDEPELGHRDRRGGNPEAEAAEASQRPTKGRTKRGDTAETMPICSVMQKCDGVPVAAELTCSVREENKAQKESYSADWHSVNLKSRPQDRQTANMNDSSRRETLTRQWRARPLTQACPSGVFRVGTVERGVREHQLLPKRNTLPLPIFIPAELGVRLGRGAPHTEADLQPFPLPDGVCPSKRTVDDITRDLPPVKPTLMEFAKAPKALGRSMSQEAQRG